MNISDQSHMRTSGTTHPLLTLDSVLPTHADLLSLPHACLRAFALAIALD